MGKRRLNIALLVSEMEDGFVSGFCEGAISAAEEIDANLYIFPGRYFDAHFYDLYRTRYDYQFNSLFEYARLSDFDVFIVTLGTIAVNIGIEKRLEFLKKFDKPIIVVAAKTEGYVNVLYDNKTGFKKAIQHLITEHKCERFGFVSGPVTSEDAQERLDAYKEVLDENRIPVNEDAIVYGNFSEYSEEEVRELMDKNPNLDAIVFANDRMVIGGYRVFKERGITVGEDISVIGFDDAPCAVMLEPNVSTVKADPGDLAYQAIINIEEVFAGNISEIVVSSSPVYRESCGCSKGFEVCTRILPQDLIDKTKMTQVLDQIYLFLFEKAQNQVGNTRIKEKIAQYYLHVHEKMAAKPFSDETLDEMLKIMRSILRMELSPYTDISSVMLLYTEMYNVLKELTESESDRRRLSETYSKLYLDYATYVEKVGQTKENEVDWLNYITTTFTRDLMNYSIGDGRAYFSIMEKLEKLYYKSAYLCLFEEKLIHPNGVPLDVPKSIQLKAYLENGKKGCPESENQTYDMKNVALKLYANREQRVTVMVTLLFSALEQYGLFVSEIDKQYLHYSTPISYQLSATVKTMDLLKENEDIMVQLKRSFAEIRQKNNILDEMSKSDELTRIYNRRGFQTTVQHQIVDPFNKGRKAIVVYADMNNLKVINDQFGHEEGDYSLRLIAEILKKAFAENGIVGRYGGDEFVAFSFVTENNAIKDIRKKIAQITKEMNEGNGKTYYVCMSVGACEFECEEDVDIQELMVKADVDLYIEKKHKRCNVLKNEDEAI